MALMLEKTSKQLDHMIRPFVSARDNYSNTTLQQYSNTILQQMQTFEPPNGLKKTVYC